MKNPYISKLINLASFLSNKLEVDAKYKLWLI